jgi:oligopeptidase B
VLQYRHHGDDWLDVLDGRGRLSHRLLLTEGAGTAWIQGAHDPASGQILIRRQGMAEPPHQRLLDLASGRWLPDPRAALPSPYQSERRWVVGKDGVKVPVSLVWRRTSTPQGTAALRLWCLRYPCAPTSRRC